MEVLKQAQYSPFSVEKQVAIIYLGTQGLLKNVAVKNVKAFEEQFLMEMESKHPEILAEFKKGVLADESLKKMTDLSNAISAQFK